MVQIRTTNSSKPQKTFMVCIWWQSNRVLEKYIQSVMSDKFRMHMLKKTKSAVLLKKKIEWVGSVCYSTSWTEMSLSFFFFRCSTSQCDFPSPRATSVASTWSSTLGVQCISSRLSCSSWAQPDRSMRCKAQKTSSRLAEGPWLHSLSIWYCLSVELRPASSSTRSICCSDSESRRRNSFHLRRGTSLMMAYRTAAGHNSACSSGNRRKQRMRSSCLVLL